MVAGRRATGTAEAQTELRRGAWVDPAGSQLTLVQLAERWLERDILPG